MLSNHKVTITADTFIDDVKIANHNAMLNMTTNDLIMNTRYIDKEACKINRDVVRDDQKDFEDFVYSLQDTLNG